MRQSIILLATAAATLSAGAAQAASVEIRDAAARVTVVPQDRPDIKVEVVRPNAELPLSVRLDGDRTVIAGGLARRIRDCNGMGENARINIRGVGRVPYAELPQVVIYTPKAVNVEANGAVVGAIGRSASVSLENAGCANWTIADVAGEADLRQSGAGNVKMGNAGRLTVRLAGAANIEAVSARDGLDAQVSGAGNVHLKSVGGPIDARLSGVGQVRIDGGRATRMRASVSGIGGIQFDGEAQDLDASISGLGGIRVRDVTGSVRKSVSGGGSVRVGARS